MNYAAALKEIRLDAPLDHVADLAANAAVESERIPYCFSINHNVGAPHYKSCPLRYDFKWGKTVGIKTNDKVVAHAWIRSALVLGYSVNRAGARTQGIIDHAPYGETWEITRIRERAVRHQNPPKLENDDDIPF